MSLFCPDLEPGIFPPAAPKVPRERGAKGWSPPDPAADRCARCGRQAWQHWTVRSEAA